MLEFSKKKTTLTYLLKFVQQIEQLRSEPVLGLIQGIPTWSNQGGETIILESIFTTFEVSSIF